MATAKPSLARARARARPIRCAPPVTNAAIGMGKTGKAPVGAALGSASPAGTALLPRPHLGPGHVACRHAGASGRRSAARAVGALAAAGGPARRFDRESEIDLLEPADLIPEPRRLFEFEVGGSLAHALFEIGDDGLQIGALVMRRFALGQSERHMVALINAVEDIGDPVAHAFRGDPMGDIVGLLFPSPPV